ncbi:MAG: hypothetical protein RSA27_03815, partial [Oscillospiraceae bacterium]
ETKKCVLSVTMSERIAHGGFEKQTIFCIPNGMGNLSKSLTFTSVKYLPHPYILHTENGFNDVKEKIKNIAWAKKIFEEKLKRANDWEPPKFDDSLSYLCVTNESHEAQNAAIVYALNGNEKLAEKVAEFLKLVGYNYKKKMHAGNQQLVHDGEFFKSCAIAYDLIYDTKYVKTADRIAIETAFRLFIERIDWELFGGNVSNWSLAEISGAMYCAEVLQDRERMERFLFGVGGIFDHLSHGVLDDGWWFECSIGYNQMAAGLFSEYTQALRPWGINISDWWVPASYSRTVQSKTEIRDGLTFDVYGECKKNYRNIKSLWDSLLGVADYRGVVLGVNDSAESRLAGMSEVGVDPRYDIAYAIYGDDAYADIINIGDTNQRDLLYGSVDLPKVSTDIHKKSCYFDNAGVAILRSQTSGIEDRERIQVAVKYGSHGGAHGHYDRCSMLGIMRYGRSFYNPENIWYSYGTFMYKFFVQSNLTHNMVTVDLKMQDPVEGKKNLFYSGEMIQACAVENTARWSYPPYFGWRVDTDESPEERSWKEGRYVNIPKDHPKYSTRTGFTEPITLKRLTVVTDEYIVNFDVAIGDENHVYDCAYHACGLTGIKAKSMDKGKHFEQLTLDPLSPGQFITDSTIFNINGNVKVSFSTEFKDEEEVKKAMWLVPFRTACNEKGKLNMDIHYVGSGESELVVGCDPQFNNVQKRLFYWVLGDKKTLAEGKFGAWILGRNRIDVNVENVDILTLKVKTEKSCVEFDRIQKAENSIFWGDPYIINKQGEKIYLSSLDLKYENTIICSDEKDYYGGDVKISGKSYNDAIGAEPYDDGDFGVIKVDISHCNAVRFVSYIGGDYPLGSETNKRNFLSQRKRGNMANFISVIEAYENQNVINEVYSEAENTVTVALKNGIKQCISVKNLNKPESNVSVKITETLDGKIIREEES